MIEEIFSTYETLCKEKNISLISEVPHNLSQINGSDECLRMLFTNLVHNAVKYNKKNGTVKISALEEKEMVSILISDNGIGIPKDKIEIIFEDFYRIKDDSTKNISGTGLGLPICKKIVTELGGEIAVHSKINEGSTFRVILPKYKG